MVMYKVLVVILVLMYQPHKPIDSINLLGLQRRRNVSPVSYGEVYRVELSCKQKDIGQCPECDRYINIPSSLTYSSLIADTINIR
jgi:hypothetical protein